MSNDHRLPPGVVVHAITGSIPLGGDRELTGELIVELPDGTLHKITGAEMSEWNAALSGFVKRWRIRDDEG